MPKTPADPDALVDILARVREAGVDVNHGDFGLESVRVTALNMAVNAVDCDESAGAAKLMPTVRELIQRIFQAMRYHS